MTTSSLAAIVGKPKYVMGTRRGRFFRKSAHTSSWSLCVDPPRPISRDRLAPEGEVFKIFNISPFEEKGRLRGGVKTYVVDFDRFGSGLSVPDARGVMNFQSCGRRVADASLRAFTYDNVVVSGDRWKTKIC